MELFLSLSEGVLLLHSAARQAGMLHAALHTGLLQVTVVPSARLQLILSLPKVVDAAVRSHGAPMALPQGPCGTQSCCSSWAWAGIAVISGP